VIYLYVDDVVASAQKMLSLNATEVFAARAEFWGDLRARMTDPFGYVWDLAQKVK
jgi:PhnB protein